MYVRERARARASRRRPITRKDYSQGQGHAQESPFLSVQDLLFNFFFLLTSSLFYSSSSPHPSSLSLSFILHIIIGVLLSFLSCLYVAEACSHSQYDLHNFFFLVLFPPYSWKKFFSNLEFCPTSNGDDGIFLTLKLASMRWVIVEVAFIKLTMPEVRITWR